MEPRRAEAAPEVVLAVWEAEDGRCEACKRAMDKRWARVARIDNQRELTADNLQLLCVDCKARRPDRLRTSTVVLGGEVAERVLGKLVPEQAELGARWLSGQLKRHGVIIMGGKNVRHYWLPGVGTFRIAFQEDGLATVVKAEKLSPEPQVRLKPQERTRGLPRPDRSPMPVPGKGAKVSKQPAAVGQGRGSA